MQIFSNQEQKVLYRLFQSTYTGQQELEMRISVISTKVIQIGHQLENKSNPRQQLVDARTTAKYLERFLDANDDVSVMFQDTSKLEQAAHIIHQLYNVLQELPNEEKWAFFFLFQREEWEFRLI